MSGRMPWPGPMPYTEDMADLFLGREEEIARILDMLQGERLSLMTASSGAGKTSLLQAGLVPAIRKLRLSELMHHPDAPPLAPYPILLNQWIGRVAKSGTIDYSQIVLLEMRRRLDASRDWYEREIRTAATPAWARAAEIELANMQTTTGAIDELANRAAPASTGLEDIMSAEVGDGDGAASGVAGSGPIARVLEAVDLLSQHLGGSLLILDQFEEILLDWHLGEQALACVESVFTQRPNTVRQLISMRHDGLHLIDALESKGLLRGRRRARIEPFTPEQAMDVLRSVSTATDVSWSATRGTSNATVLEDLIAAFTDQSMAGGRRAGQVNLVGLQIVLNGIFTEEHIPGDRTITYEALGSYCKSLSTAAAAPCPHSWLSGGDLRREAPRRWLLACLRGSAAHEAGHEAGSNIYEPQVLPMASRMAWLLVTPTGNKRPMNRSALHNEAYRDELQDMDPEGQDLAGIARSEAWSPEKLSVVLEETCDEALNRLVRGNILKMRGAGGTSDAAFELVHDQFGKPFQSWASDFDSTPEFDLNALRAIQSRPFRWSGALAPHDDDGVIACAVWRDCTLNGIDLSNLHFVRCDFSDTLFSNCTFHGVTFEECTIAGVTFKGNSHFSNVDFDTCDLGGAVFDRGASLEGVRVRRGHGLDFALFRGARLQDCEFDYPEDELDETGERELLDMRYLRFVDCAFCGSNIFVHCNLDGAVFTGNGDAMRLDGSIAFRECEMQSFEMSNVDVRGRQLTFEKTNCRGALFDRIDAGIDEDNRRALVSFKDAILVGATARGCVFENVEFLRGDASTFVISARPATARANARTSTLARIKFTDIKAENLTVEGCRIVDYIRFSNCQLSGATFTGDKDTRDLAGDMIFEKNCDLSAAEFRNLHFTSTHQLRMNGCRGQGVSFREVALDGDPGDAPAGLFLDTDLTGALFWGCAMQNCEFSGNSKSDPAEMAAMAIRPIVDRRNPAANRPSRVSGLRFRHVAMTGFLMRDVEILGDLVFEDCDIGYASFGRPRARKKDLMHIMGDLKFSRCDMTAIEFSGLQFINHTLEIGDSDCRSAMLSDVSLVREPGAHGGLHVRDSALTCSRLSACRIDYGHFSGDSAGIGRLSDAVAMMFEGSTSRQSKIGDITIEDYVIDGGSFEHVELVGPVLMRECSLLRTKFMTVVGGAGGRLDLTQSDLLYAQIAPELLANPDVLLITDEQRAAAGAMSEHVVALKRQHGVE